ncbi:stalk domain-containing protein [Paenibacillus campi]|uniref:stalk domain-containing protein n=1 Tax=Paenibacillus campi TaxID=3106031 RepID=UPI002AFEF939|nr:stalk domain-containing protein [Paenibacillus sp. SGZ-1014]
MMKTKKWIAAAMTAGFVMTGSAGVYAGTQLEAIKAYMNHGIQIEVDGKAYTPKGANGTELAPITYNGSTYLPVRSLADALNVPVNYNAAQSKVSIGKGSTSSGTNTSSGNPSTGNTASNGVKAVSYTASQIQQMKEARSDFGVPSFATPYAPTQIGSQDQFVKVAAADGADSVNLLYKHMIVSAAARDNSGGDFGKGGTKVQLANGVTGTYYAATSTMSASLTFELNDNYFTIRTLDSSLTKDQLVAIAGSVSKL